METITEKYSRVRQYIKDGDIVLFHGRGLVASIIQNCDSSYFNHVGIVFEKLGALYIVDANENGVQADRLSFRIKKYSPNGDFTILKPTATNEEIQKSLTKILKRSDEKTIKYDFWNGFKELMNRRFGWNLKVDLDESHDICSDYVSTYQVELKMVSDEFLKLRIAFPQDSIRYMTDNVIIIN
jgi:hypothetical protein